MLDIKLVKIILLRRMEMLKNSQTRSCSSWLFGCDFPVIEFSTDKEATEYQREREKEEKEKEKLAVC